MRCSDDCNSRARKPGGWQPSVKSSSPTAAHLPRFACFRIDEMRYRDEVSVALPFVTTMLSLAVKFAGQRTHRTHLRDQYLRLLRDRIPPFFPLPFSLSFFSLFTTCCSLSCARLLQVFLPLFSSRSASQIHTSRFHTLFTAPLFSVGHRQRHRRSRSFFPISLR